MSENPKMPVIKVNLSGDSFDWLKAQVLKLKEGEKLVITLESGIRIEFGKFVEEEKPNADHVLTEDSC